MRWKLEDGTWVTPEDLAEEITRVPRTSFWRLSHLAFLWPEIADPERHDLEAGGFGDGFALELVPIEGAVEWLLQPINGDAHDRVTGVAPVGRKAVEAAFERMDAWVADRETARRDDCPTT